MATGRRERINENQYGRRDEKGRFDEVESKRRADTQDRKRKAKGTSKPGYGDRGDRKR